MTDNQRSSGRGLDHYELAQVNEDFREDFRRLMELRRQRKAEAVQKKFDEWLRWVKGED